MWEVGYNESLAPKNWWFSTVVLGETLESPLVCKEIQPVYPKGNQPWIFIGRTDAEAEAPILWPLEEAQAGIKIAGRNMNNLRYADDTTLMAESEEELKSLLMKVKEASENLA